MGAATPNTGNTGNNTETYQSNAYDMPKTGDGDAIRILIALLIFVFGCIQIVSSIPTKRKVVVKQR